MEFIHASDWQLGMTRWFLELNGSEAQARFHESRLDTIDRIGELAASGGAEFIIVVGGVPDPSTLLNRVPLRALERVVKLPVSVYLLPGNHDAFDAFSVSRRNAFESLEDRGVYIIRDSEPTFIRGGVELISVPVCGRYSADDIMAGIVVELELADGIRVMVVYGQVEGFGADAGATTDLTSLGQTTDREMLYHVALGDSHSMSRLDHVGRTYFSSAHETTAYDDKKRDSGNTLVAEIAEDDLAKGSATMAPHRMGQWAFRVIDMDITDTGDLSELFAELDGIEARTDTAVKHSL